MSLTMTMYRGDSKRATLTVTADDGSQVNISKAWFTAKKYPGDGTAVISLNTTDNPSNMAIGNNPSIAPTVSLVLLPINTSALTTGNYLFDFQVQLANSDIQTMSGVMGLKADMTP